MQVATVMKYQKQAALITSHGMLGHLIHFILKHGSFGEYMAEEQK